jgi:hypothetical protein
VAVFVFPLGAEMDRHDEGFADFPDAMELVREFPFGRTFLG